MTRFRFWLEHGPFRFAKLGALLLLGSLYPRVGHAEGAEVAQASAAAAVRTREPSVAEVVRMVRRASETMSPERIRSLARRARLAGLMPSLRLGADRGLKQNLTASSSGETERTNASLGDDMSVDATLSFDLPRLVFASEEVRLLSVERWLLQDRKKLVDEAVKLYFQRKRLRVEWERTGRQEPEIAIAIEETEALLDALSEGAFSRALGKPAERADSSAHKRP